MNDCSLKCGKKNELIKFVKNDHRRIDFYYLFIHLPCAVVECYLLMHIRR